MNPYRWIRGAVLASYAALAGWLVLWPTWLSPPGAMPPLLAAGLLLAPLVLPAPGLLAGRPYTHAWASFLVLIYFAFLLTETLINPAQRPYALIGTLLSLSLFIACVLYPKAARGADR